MGVEHLTASAINELYRWRAGNPGPDVEPEDAISEIATDSIPRNVEEFLDLINDDQWLLTALPDHMDGYGCHISAAEVIQQVLQEKLEDDLWDEWEEMLEEERWQRLERRRQR